MRVVTYHIVNATLGVVTLTLLLEVGGDAPHRGGHAPATTGYRCPNV